MTGMESAWTRPVAALASLPADTVIVDLEHRAPSRLPSPHRGPIEQARRLRVTCLRAIPGVQLCNLIESESS